MKKIKNPNDIVSPLVQDYQEVFKDAILSLIMYGSAVTHEYRPGISDINIAIVLTDNSIATVAPSIPLQKKWAKSGVATPFFMTQAYITSSLDTYPVEFLDMQSNYRVLYGEDILQNLEIKHEHIRLQCERELKSVAIHLRRSFVQCMGNNKLLASLLSVSLRRLIPIFKGLLVLKEKTIPKSKSSIISAVEDVYNLGASSLSEVLNAQEKKLAYYDTLFDDYAKDIDRLTEEVDTLTHKEQ